MPINILRGMMVRPSRREGGQNNIYSKPCCTTVYDVCAWSNRYTWENRDHGSGNYTKRPCI